MPLLRLSDDLLQRPEIFPCEHFVGKPSGHVLVQPEQPNRRSIHRLDAPVRGNRHDTGRDPLEDRFEITAALFDLGVLLLEVQPRPFELLLTRGELAGHRVEGLDQRSELVPRLRLDAMIQASGTDFTCSGSQPLHRTGDPLGEIQPHPCCADKNHQRHHQEDGKIDPLEGGLEDEQAAVTLVGVRQPA